MELSNEAYNTLVQYFKGLNHIGYKSYTEVYQVLAFLFIEEILYGPMSFMVTDKDYKDINQALYCIYGSCLIPYPSYLKGMSSSNIRVKDNYRITESEILRSANYALRAVL